MIRSELDVLLDKVQDPALRADLRSQIDRIKQRRSFGLVFEQHIPERVRLPQHPIRVGSQVVSRDDDDSPTFEVVLIDDGVATLVQVQDADGAYVQRSEHGTGGQEQAPVHSLVVISDFGEPVLPGFRHVGSIDRGGDRPYHVVINGENHHALEALRFTHAGKVDCIYIDPPYNSGARDWKYNNDYVDDTDAYRHSKWLAFMERRLKLAKELLNPDDSVLIVTIDEKEYLRLGLLLEQTFPSSLIQMVSSVVKPGGTSRVRGFSRVAEYLFFVFLGSADIIWTGDNMLAARTDNDSALSESSLWEGMVRRGIGVVRRQRPKQFYPIYINPELARIVGSGEPLGPYASRDEAPSMPGTTVVWPIKDDGTEGFWQLSPSGLERARQSGTVRVGSFNAKTGQFRIQYMKAKKAKAVAEGAVATLGKDQNGVVILDLASSSLSVESTPRTVWNRAAHDASVGGAGMLNRMLPGRKFPYPKSLYAVEDTIRFFVKDKPDAVVLDFFAGSGTTAHAVARLNRQDGGRRQSIMVTNNEVSADESKDLRNQGLRPGEREWEALGIFQHITRPRVTAAITGRMPDGGPIQGDYRFTDEFPMADGFEENVAFLELRYLDADDIDLGHAFGDIGPLLWLRAGGQGPIASRVDDAGVPLPYVWTDRYGVLFVEDRWRSFVSARPETARTAYIVTYSPTVFAGIAAELPPSMDTIRLYNTYLSMFLRERGRA
ncbi:MAG TPA: DNA methyltransferase [Patescibacteria group bacterium]|nr:DNA methyltransferase [Patescibacteria group bacterium]